MFLISPQLLLVEGKEMQKIWHAEISKYYPKKRRRRTYRHIWWAQIWTIYEFLTTEPTPQLYLWTSNEFISKSIYSGFRPFKSLFSSRKIALPIIIRIIIHGAPLMPSGFKLRKPEPQGTRLHYMKVEEHWAVGRFT